MKENITKLVFDYPNKEIPKSDIAIVLGGYKMIPNRVNGALELYQKRIVKKILVTGRRNYFKIKKKLSEAELMANYLEEHGVPKEDILREEKSQSTYMNLKLSQKILAKSYDLNNLTVVLVTSQFHLKRCLLVAKNYFKNIYGYPVLDNITDKDCWKNNHIGRKIILREALLLKYYQLTKKIKNV